MREEAEAAWCERCGHTMERNGLIEADRPESEEL